MGRVPSSVQAGLLGLAILLVGAIGVLALNGQLLPGSMRSTWTLTVLHTNDVLGHIDPCG